MRLSSATCTKRSGKIFSVTTLFPSARHNRAINWACKSVGKPGNGCVVTSIGSSRRADETVTTSSPRSTFTPTAERRSTNAIR